MPPCSSSSYIAYYTFGDIESSGQLSQRLTMSNPFNLGGLFFRKFSCARIVASAFRVFVSHVVQIGSKKKMISTYARRTIAGVKNIQSIWNWTEVNDPTNSVCQTTVIPFTVRIPQPITSWAWKMGSNPQPAAFGLFNLAPKSLEDCFRKTLRDEISECIRSLHIKFLLMCRVLGCSFTAGTSSFYPKTEG